MWTSANEDLEVPLVKRSKLIDNSKLALKEKSCNY